MSEEKKNLATTDPTALTKPEEQGLVAPETPMGFDEDSGKDLVIPRIKVINALSPERQDGIAEEGALLNSLTTESVKGKRFIPIRQYYSNIHWNPDRDSEPRIFCRSFDGRVGQSDVGVVGCATCRLNQFDNTKTGKDAQPQCTAYLNFLGFIEGSPMPIVLSFARTNYNEGRKMLSMAKSLRQAIWNFAYVLDTKLIAKDRNKWYIITANLAGETTAEERVLAAELFKAYQNTQVNADLEETGATAAPSTDAATEDEL